MAIDWQQYQDKYDALPVRLRLLLFLAAVMVLVLIVDLIWLTPTMDSIQKHKQKLNEQNNQIASLTAQLSQTNARIYAIQHSSQQQEIEQLDAQILALKQSLENSTLNLINPAEMVGLLRSIVDGFNQLTLIKIDKLPAEPVSDATTKTQGEAAVQLYRHRLILRFKGNYRSTIEFLQVLEKLPRKMQFDRLDYQVEGYPNAMVTIELSTLSFNKEWIGG